MDCKILYLAKGVYLQENRNFRFVVIFRPFWSIQKRPWWKLPILLVCYFKPSLFLKSCDPIILINSMSLLSLLCLFPLHKSQDFLFPLLLFWSWSCERAKCQGFSDSGGTLRMKGRLQRKRILSFFRRKPKKRRKGECLRTEARRRMCRKTARTAGRSAGLPRVFSR